MRRVDAVTGAITTVAGNGGRGFSGDGGPATLATFASPEGVALDAAGNLYIADVHNQRVRRVDAVTHIITTVAGNGEYGDAGDGGPATNAVGISIAANGDIYFADVGNNRIRKVSAATGVITTVAGGGNLTSDGVAATDASLNVPTDVKIDPNGNLIISDAGDHTIRRDAAATNIITIIARTNKVAGFTGDGGPAVSAQLAFPIVTAIDTAGNLYVADLDNFRVRRVDAASKIITTVAGGKFGDGENATSAELLSPSSVAIELTHIASCIYRSADGTRVATAATLTYLPTSPSIAMGTSTSPSQRKIASCGSTRPRKS